VDNESYEKHNSLRQVNAESDIKHNSDGFCTENKQQDVAATTEDVQPAVAQIQKLMIDTAIKTDEVKEQRSAKKKTRKRNIDGNNLDVDKEKLENGSVGTSRDLAEVFRVKYRKYRKFDYLPKRADVRELKGWKNLLEKYEDFELLEGTLTYCLKDWELLAGRSNISGEPTANIFCSQYIQGFVLEYQRGGPPNVVDKYTQMRKRSEKNGEAPVGVDCHKLADDMAKGVNAWEVFGYKKRQDDDD
jgi:hypothetical protein